MLPTFGEKSGLACELPARQGIPLSRWSHRELARQVYQAGLVASISGTTLWRWLHEDAIRPWQHRCWLFPRHPDFFAKASRLLDLYQNLWEGQPLRPDEFVLCAMRKLPSRPTNAATRLCLPNSIRP